MSTLTTLTTSGHQSNLHILDNESSSSQNQGFLKNDINYQLVPPHLHIQNTSKRDMQALKQHFIICLCTDNPKYPAREWDCLLPQKTTTLNTLHNCHFNTKLSAYAGLHGMFDYNKTPLDPLGTIVLVRKKTTNCHTG